MDDSLHTNISHDMFYNGYMKNTNTFLNNTAHYAFETNSDEEEEERISLSASKQISFGLRQPSFISLTGQVITKGGEEIGSSTSQETLSTLDLINIQNNNGKFENPILVIENADCINVDNYPDQRQNSYDHFNLPEKRPTNFAEVQALTAQRLRSRNQDLWRQIGYFPK